MTELEIKEAAFEDGVWRLQLEASRVALMMEDLRRDKLCFNLTGALSEWIVVLQTHKSADHADDERRASHGT